MEAKQIAHEAPSLMAWLFCSHHLCHFAFHSSPFNSTDSGTLHDVLQKLMPLLKPSCYAQTDVARPKQSTFEFGPATSVWVWEPASVAGSAFAALHEACRSQRFQHTV